jgi:hypothetical protein
MCMPKAGDLWHRYVLGLFWNCFIIRFYGNRFVNIGKSHSSVSACDIDKKTNIVKLIIDRDFQQYKLCNSSYKYEGTLVLLEWNKTSSGSDYRQWKMNYVWQERQTLLRYCQYMDACLQFPDWYEVIRIYINVVMQFHRIYKSAGIVKTNMDWRQRT